MGIALIATSVVVYALVMYIIFKLFEKFFKFLFFIVTLLFVAALAYLVMKGF